MPYSEQQQESNLVFFLHEFVQPAAEAVRSFSLLAPTTRDYSTFSFLESFLWLHLGVKLDYFSKAQSRRVMYEFGNHWLAAYQRTVNAKMLQKFSPPLQRILEAEFSGRVELFGSVEETPAPSDELTSAYQTTLVLVGGFSQDIEANQLLRMLVFANLQTWELATGRVPAPTVLRPDLQIEIETLPQEWARPGLFKLVQFMQAFRQMTDDFDKLYPATSTKLSSQMFLLKRYLKEMQQWRLNFGDQTPRERFLQVASDATRVVQEEIKKDGGAPKHNVETQSLIASIYDLLTDWGAPPLTRGAEGL
jgi:hypothetical protein